MLSAQNMHNQRGNTGVGFIFIVAVVIIVITLLPAQVSPTSQQPCMVGVPPTKQETLRLPAIKMDQKFGEDDNPVYWGYQDRNDMRDYVLIRSHVPTSKETIPAGWLMLGGPPPVTGLWHTVNHGEQPEKPGYDLYYPLSAGEIDPGMTPEGYSAVRKTDHLNNAGLLLFVNKDSSTVKSKDGKTIVDVEIYQDKKVMDSPNKKLTYEEMFACYGGRAVEDPHLTIPAQSNSPDQEQLQLQWIYLTSSNYWAVHCKPAVYLYPPKKTLVNVKVHPAGFLSYVDPQYDKDTGWNVLADPSGKLQMMNNKDKIYDYLYFESKIRDEVIKKPSKGWIIESGKGEWFSPLEQKFKDILPKLGLNQVQTRDFIEYWKKALPYSPYYFVGVINQSNVDEIERLEITPQPDSINRVRIYFEQLDQEKTVEAPLLVNTIFEVSDTEFKVVEWGGMVKNDPNHPFTCSQ